MSKQVCLITGASNGIGKATAVAMAERGFEVFLHGRSQTKLNETRDQIIKQIPDAELSLLVADLNRLEEVRRLADSFLATGKPLHCLISNAGITNSRRVLTEDGHEEMFAVNHLAPFLLCNLLQEKLQASAPARVVIVASGAHAFCKGIRFADLSFAQNFKSMQVYGHSKLANMLFTRELARRMENTGVTVNCCHPGAVGTGLGTNNGLFGKVIMAVLKPFFRSPEKGAETSVFMATSPEVATVNGAYYYNCRRATAKPWAEDDTEAARLWDVSVDLVGL